MPKYAFLVPFWELKMNGLFDERDKDRNSLHSFGGIELSLVQLKQGGTWAAIRCGPLSTDP